MAKYAYLIDGPSAQGKRADILVDGTLSSLFGQNTFNWLPRPVRILLLKIEIWFWLRLNRIADKVNIHWSPDTIQNRGALYLFSYKNCVGAFSLRKPVIDQFPVKIVNMSHYFIRTGEKATNIKSLSGVFLAAEADLSCNPYFLKSFPADARFIILPFAVSSRFDCRKPMSARAATCAATGSYHKLTEEKPYGYYREFIDHFQIDTYHPVRKMLFERRTELAGLIDVQVSLYRERARSRGILNRLFRWLGYDVKQSEYFSFDIAEFYNDHQLAIVGEEIAGLPTIGFFEAMACGCVVLGQRGHFYDKLGLMPGMHYLEHDGSFEGIKSTIQAAIKDRSRLETISRNGLDYVAKHCRGPLLWQALEKALAAPASSL